MDDMLANASAWLDSMRRQHLSRWVTYQRGAESQPCLASVSKSDFETQTDTGLVERWESRDYLISYHEMPFPVPQRGDRILETLNNVTVTFEVCSPRGMPAWHWADPHRTAIRVHTKAVAET